MPVTAKLSRAFYDKFGDAVADELVNWFNQVDLTYRTELRELNDLNFTRFDARVGERLASLRVEVEATLRAEMDRRFAQVDHRLEALAKEIRDTKTAMVKWMFGFWIGTVLSLAGLMVALNRT